MQSFGYKKKATSDIRQWPFGKSIYLDGFIKDGQIDGKALDALAEILLLDNASSFEAVLLKPRERHTVEAIAFVFFIFFCDWWFLVLVIGLFWFLVNDCRLQKNTWIRSFTIK